MKLKQTLQTLCSVLLLMLTGCAADKDAPESLGENGSHNPDAPVEFTARTTEGGDNELKTVFTNGTEIGIKVDGYDEYTNVKYKYQDGKFVPSEPHKAIFFGQGKEDLMKQADYTAYYPYQENADYDNPSIQNDQQAPERYYASDALIATGKLGEEMEFGHRMAKAFITTSDPVDFVGVLNQPLTAGSPDQTGSPYALSVNEERTEWRVILVPGKRNIKMVMQKGGKTYFADFGEKTLAAGQQYTYEVKLGPNLDLSLGDVTLTEPGEYTVIQSKGGVTGHCLKIETGGDVTVRLKNVNIQAPTAIHAANSGTAKLILDTKTTVVSTGAGEPGISIGSNVNLRIEGNNQELWATGGPSGYFLPAGPAIGAACNNYGTNNNLHISLCHLHCKVIGPYTAIIGTCGDVPEQRSRYSMIGDIEIISSALYLEQNMTADQGDYIGNGKIGKIGYGNQHLSVNRIWVQDCIFAFPGDPNVTMGILQGTQPNGSYSVKNGVWKDGIHYPNGYGQRPG